jgi:hypothetical protein
MASYNSYSSSMGERKLTIDSFTGIDQTRGLHSADYGSSPDAVNFVTRDGALKTAGGVSAYGSPAPSSVYESANGRIFQGFFRDAQHNDFSKIVMALHGRFYVADPDAQTWTAIAGSLTNNDWSAVNYRDEDVDWIILTNGVDTAQYWDGVSESSFPLNIVQGRIVQDSEVLAEGEALHFSKITMLNERLWGGVASEYPDRVYWSKTFDPEDWEFNFVDSENDGGGFVDVATFDGSRIRAVVSAMDDILIFKDKSLHRLNGSYPGEFSLTQVFGTEGTLAPRTIVNDGRSLYFLASEGLVRYSGMTAISLSSQGDKKLREIWPRINASTIDTACATMMNNIIYLAVPLDGSIINTHVIEYDIQNGTYNLIELPGVDDWLVLREGQKETLLFLSGDQLYRYDSGYTFYDNEPIEAVWTSPFISCGTLSSKKQTGRIYMSITATSLDVTKQPQIKLTLLSGNNVRSKLIKLKNGLNEIRKRVKVKGRMFRFRIENVDGNPLTIHRGIEIHIEEDFD